MIKRMLVTGFSLSFLMVCAIAIAGNAASLGFVLSVRVGASTQRVESIIVTQVHAGSPAAKAGILVGDEIVEIDDAQVHGALAANLWIKKQSIKQGVSVRLRVRHRDGAVEVVEVRAAAANVV